MSDPIPLRSWAEIDLASLERNVGRIRGNLPQRLRFVAVVKADAYGHGIRATATRLMQSGADLFAVANVGEARTLRELGAGWPILLLSPVLPGECECLFTDQLIPSLSSIEELDLLERLAARRRQQLTVHLKVDTGMARAGVWHSKAGQLLDRVLASPAIELGGIYTHFACADSDPDFTGRQRARLGVVLRQIPETQRSALLIHADNSAGLESFDADSPHNAIRVGLLQFGILPHATSALNRVRVEPVLSFHTRVSLVKSVPAGTGVGYGHQYRTRRRSSLAMLTAGYGDGIPLALSNRGQVLIRGRRCAIRGRVCMDQTIIDASNLPGLQPGEQATLIGTQGKERISLTEFAETAGTIPYEILTSVTARVTRIYRASRD